MVLHITEIKMQIFMQFLYRDVHTSYHCLCVSDNVCSSAAPYDMTELTLSLPTDVCL